ncbi:MAG: phosphatase [Gammaproteobacteria bacterium]|nr:phosphatase [Gammaproteobacteria bacterium]
MCQQSIAEIFTHRAGGLLLVPADKVAEHLQHINAFMFDWDGVFNNGFKQGESGSGFSEIDSMGTNLLRFGYWLLHGRLPFFAIITGERNPAAIALAEREHFNAIYFKTRNKLAALEHLQQHFSIKPQQIAYGFDDVLDLAIARSCGLRFLVNCQASPLFEQYVKDRQLCDYITGQSGDNHAVREVCELMLGLMGQYDQAVELRSMFDARYTEYLELRNSGVTEMFSYNEQSGKIEKE